MSDQQTPPGEVQPAVTPDAQALQGPWAQDVQQAFTDPDVQRAVDSFLRERVQPHVTRLEQKTAQLSQAEALYNDLQQSPGDTYVAITQELFGDEAVDRVVRALQAGDADQAAAELQAAETPATPTVEVQQPALPPEDRELLERIKQRELQNEYDTALEAFIQGDPAKGVEGHPDVVKSVFHAFVASAGGDFNKAYASYQEFKSDVQQHPEQFGLSPAITPDQVPNPDEVAPPVVGSGQAQGQTTPPVQKTYTSFDDAIDDFMAEVRPTAPPTVGSV